jgi:aminoglycoside phosphotransferase (APT) family kinase protein
MSQRPPSDRPLDADRALAAVREQLPKLECARAEYLASGWATDAYRLGDDLVARFPRTVEAAAWVDFDEAVLRLVAAHLGPVIAVPTVAGRGRPGAHFPYDFLVCAIIRGESDDECTLPMSEQCAEELAGDLGRALAHIHAVPLEAAHAAGVRPFPWADSRYAGPQCFLHGDFRGGNILLVPGTGRLAGVIDWGNCAIGDPALDFAALVLWRGWPFMQRALAAYGRPVDASRILEALAG